MKRKAPLKRSPVRKRNDQRLKKRREQEYGPKGDWIVGFPCAVYANPRLIAAGCERRIVPAHAAKTRGAGGKAEHLIPLCTHHESVFHTIGRRTFEKRYSVCLTTLAAMYENEWQRIQEAA